MLRKQKRFVAVALGVVVLATVAAVSFFIRAERKKQAATPPRFFEVYFVWDHGVKDLRIIDKRTGRDEPEGKARKLIVAEAVRLLGIAIPKYQLGRAFGIIGCGFGTVGSGLLLDPEEANCSPPMDHAVIDPDSVTPLMLAVHSGDQGKVFDLLRAGADVNSRDQSGRTILIEAISGGESRLAIRLLAARADPNLKDRFGYTALMLAAHRGQADVVKVLLRRGAAVNAKSEGGYTALFEAMGVKRTDIVRILVAAGADVNTRTDRGETPLIRAVLENNIEAASLLIAARADMNARDEKGRTALAIAKEKRNSEIIHLLKRAGAKE